MNLEECKKELMKNPAFADISAYGDELVKQTRQDLLNELLEKLPGEATRASVLNGKLRVATGTDRISMSLADDYSTRLAYNQCLRDIKALLKDIGSGKIEE